MNRITLEIEIKILCAYLCYRLFQRKTRQVARSLSALFRSVELKSRLFIRKASVFLGLFQQIDSLVQYGLHERILINMNLPLISPLSKLTKHPAFLCVSQAFDRNELRK